MKGLSKVWIVGDNFLAETYRKCFKKSSHDFYLKACFEVLPFCSNKYSDKNSNLISRIVNSFVLALSTKHYLPDYVIVLLDDDLIEHLQFKNFKAASLLGPWVEYLSEFFAESLQTRRMQLPKKARLEDITPVYWIEPVSHNSFSYTNQQIREKYTRCLEASSKSVKCMRVLKLRDFWNRGDDSLVLNDKFTKMGLASYLKSLDSSFQFNVKKHVEFLIRSRFRSLKARGNTEDSRPGQIEKFAHEDNSDQEDEIIQFFSTTRKDDRFHWNRQPRNRFLLPRPKNCKF